MPNSTPETRKDIREIYNQVPKGIRLMSEAVPHLLAILGLPAKVLSREEPQLMYKELATL